MRQVVVVVVVVVVSGRNEGGGLNPPNVQESVQILEI